ncbi:MAG: class C sortase [Coriobacteriales bacterium]|nr:class C sortase [Coriobacteriales bacterium]
MNRLKKNILNILIVVMGLAGVILLAYPTFSDWWNSMHQSYAIASYDQAVAEMDPHKYDELLAAAEKYNAELAKTGINWSMSDEQMKVYNSLLDVTGTGMMGYVEIPKINVELPLYHGTRDAVLQVAIGHITGTSLPVGGVGSHCSVSGHRGLPSARLFTDIDVLDKGDIFTITVLDRVLTYEVDQVRIVLPADLGDLAIDQKKDYVTLITCTPYGINSHRLLVRGHRIDNLPGTVRVMADAVQIKPYLVAVFLAIPILVTMLVWVMLSTSRRIRYRRVKQSAADQFRQRRSERMDQAAEHEQQANASEPREEE